MSLPGRHNCSSIRFADRPFNAGVKRTHYLLALNHEYLLCQLGDLVSEGTAFCVEGEGWRPQRVKNLLQKFR